MAEPTCLTPCESTSFFVCVLVRVNVFPLWRKWVGHQVISYPWHCFPVCKGVQKTNLQFCE
jgi:hypothetical protein